jgi:hypothetical protein
MFPGIKAAKDNASPAIVWQLSSQTFDNIENLASPKEQAVLSIRSSLSFQSTTRMKA